MAGARDIRIGVKVDGLDKTRQDFKSVEDAVRALGPASDATAAEITWGFSTIEKASDAAAKKIADGQQASAKELDGLIAEFSRTADAIAKAFPTGPPDALATALTKAEQRIRDVIAASDKVPASLDAARTAFKKLETAPDGVEVATRRMERALDDYAAKMAKDGDVGKGDIEKIWKAQILLNDEIKATGKTLDQLGPDYAARYQQMETATDKAATTVKKLETETDRLKGTQIATNTQFNGFGDALVTLDPKMAKFVTSLAGITGALSAGLAMGGQFNNFVGTDMQEWDDLAEGQALKIKTILEKFFDFLAEGTQAVMAKLSGNADEFEAHAARARQASDELDAAVNKSGEAYRADAEASKAAADALKAAQDGVQQATKGTSEKVDDLVNAMQKLAPEGALNSQEMTKLAGEMQGVVDKLDNLTPKERARLQLIIDTAKNSATLSAEQKQAFIQELADLDRLNETRKDGQGITIKWTDAAKQASAETAKLSKEQATGATGMIQFSNATDDAAGKSKKLESVLQGMKDSSGASAKSMTDLGKGIVDLSTHAPDGADAVKKVDDSMKTLSVTTPPVAASLAAVAKEGVKKIADEGPKAATSLHDFADAIGKFKPDDIAAIKTNLAEFAPDAAKINDAATATNNLAAAVERLNLATSAGADGTPYLKPKSLPEPPAGVGGPRQSPL